MLTAEQVQAQRDAFGEEPRRIYERIIDAVRSAARDRGYAIAVHGSLARDIDLVAVPWVDSACEPMTLAKAIAAAISGLDGIAAHVAGAIDQGNGEVYIAPLVRAHGRMSWVIGLQSDFHSTQGHPWIDLSVMPRL